MFTLFLLFVSSVLAQSWNPAVCTIGAMPDSNAPGWRYTVKNDSTESVYIVAIKDATSRQLRVGEVMPVIFHPSGGAAPVVAHEDRDLADRRYVIPPGASCTGVIGSGYWRIYAYQLERIGPRREPIPASDDCLVDLGEETRWVTCPIVVDLTHYWKARVRQTQDIVVGGRFSRLNTPVTLRSGSANWTPIPGNR